MRPFSNPSSLNRKVFPCYATCAFGQYDETPVRHCDTPSDVVATSVDSSKKPVTMTITVSQSQSPQQRQPITGNRHFPTILTPTKAIQPNKETPCENRMSWVQIPLARQTKKPGISTILGFFFYPAAKRFIRFYPMTVEPIWPCGLRDFCDVGTPPASQFDSMRHRFPLPNLK